MFDARPSTNPGIIGIEYIDIGAVVIVLEVPMPQCHLRRPLLVRGRHICGLQAVNASTIFVTAIRSLYLHPIPLLIIVFVIAWGLRARLHDVKDRHGRAFDVTRATPLLKTLACAFRSRCERVCLTYRRLTMTRFPGPPYWRGACEVFSPTFDHSRARTAP